uniref:Peptidase_M13 domain-containing protein n=1 Tax=Globodera pallida TaxID=36090 RepID=A0A183BSR9_GLOPA
MVFGSICANITFGGDKPAMNWFQNQLLVTAKAILDNVKSYISTELNNSFPKIETGVVKTIISEMGLKPPVTDNSTVAATLNTIFNELNEYGNRKFVRQGFVSTNLENETNFAMRCAPENCFSLLDVTGLHVMVTRFNTDIDEVRAIKSYEWLYNVGPKGFSNASFMWGFINTNYNVDKVSVLMSNLEKKMFKLTNDDLYRSVAILRGSGRQCGVNAVSRAHKIEEYAASGSVYYHFVGSFWHDCENYFFYFYT